jgi:hypothetical protein
MEIEDYMFGVLIYDYKPYRLLGAYKNGDFHTAVYSRDENGVETITSMASGEVFYNLIDYTRSIYGLAAENEWAECLYLDDDIEDDDETSKITNNWAPLFCLRVN